jgi:hypothetical protein
MYLIFDRLIDPGQLSTYGELLRAEGCDNGRLQDRHGRL